jgi:coniferyl-aldehyde dehydrogenase
MSGYARASTNDHALQAIFAKQRDAFHSEGTPALGKRRADLLKLKTAILVNRRAYEAAIDADFGHRPARETALMELLPTVQGIEYLGKNLARWMRPRRRRVAIHLRPGSAKVLYQPLGVVGIMSPWNYPVGLSLMPLATAIAAGNRAMIKPSEFTPRTTELIYTTLREIFPETEVAVVSGGAAVGAAFSTLPFDHLLFTGSSNVGRKVMRAASDNLVPVTLELGGKSPAIIDQQFSLVRAAGSIVFGKLTNAGQTCIAPDYALVQEREVASFIDAFQQKCQKAYPDGISDESYSAIVSERHYERLQGLIRDARMKGAEIIEVYGHARQQRERTLAPTIILGATSEMAVMREEIFGPVLPVISYETIEDAISYVNARPRPLALYLFSDRRGVVEQVLARTTSGNVTVNDTLLHYAVDDLPFGGVGASGMGHYHGEEGFRSLSHAKGVFTQARWNLAGLVRAPFGRMTDRVLSYFLR